MPFTIEEFQDLVRLLERRPEWRAALRSLVLSDELLAVPEQLATFRTETERRFAELATEMATFRAETEQRFAELRADTEQRFAELRADTEQRFAEVAAEIAELTRKMATLSDHVAELKGSDLEARYRIKAHAYFGPLLRRIHVLSPDELVALVDSAVEGEILSDDQAHEIFLADAVVRGRRREDGAEVYLVVEVSWGVGPDDVERAVKRAELLAKTGVSTLPVVAGKTVTAEAARLARSRNVWQVSDGQVDPPQRPSELS